MRRPISYIATAALILGVAALTWIAMRPALDSLLYDSNDAPHDRKAFEEMKLRDPATGEIPPGIRARELEFATQLPARSTADWTAGKTGTNWQARGPYRTGGRTRALAYDRTNPSIILAGAASGGIWRSSDGGNSWTQVTTNEQLPSVTSIVQSVRSSRIWYASMGEVLGSQNGYKSAFYRGDGVYKSTDNGVTWSALVGTQSGNPSQFDDDFDYVYRLVVDPSVGLADPDVILAATIGGIYRSADSGATWARVLGLGYESATYYADVTVSTSGVFYATLTLGSDETDGFYRSTDGVNWRRIDPLAGMSWMVLATAPSAPNTVYFVGRSHPQGQCVLDDVKDTPTSDCSSLFKYTYVSGDGTGAGGTLENRSSSLPAAAAPPYRRGSYRTQRNYNVTLAVHPDDPDLVILGGVYLWRSTDGFATSGNTTPIGGYVPTFASYDWYDNHHPDQHALVFHPTSVNRLLSGHDGGISETTNVLAPTVAWTSLNNGYQTTQAYAVGLDQSTTNDETVIAGFQDNRTQLAQGSASDSEWTMLFSGDGGPAYIRAGKEEVYFSSQNGVTFRTELDGLTGWTQSARIDPRFIADRLFISPFMPDPDDDKRLYFGVGRTLIRVNDATAVPFGTTTPNPNFDRLTTITAKVSAIAAGAGNRVYLGGSSGEGGSASLYRLDNDHLDVPDRTFLGSGLPNAYVSSIAIDPEDTDKVMVTFSNYGIVSVYYSQNAGATWSAVAGNLEENADGSGDGPSVRWATIIGQGSARTYLVGTSIGLFSTSFLAGPATVWTQEGADVFGNVIVEHMMGRSSDGFLAVGTHGKGIYSGYVSAGVEGIIRDRDDQPLAGVAMNGLPGTPVTDAQGRYSAGVPWNWTGTVTPAKSGHDFRPRSLQFSGVQGGAQQDFYEPRYAGQVPTDGMQLWLRADRGIDLDGAGNVAAWRDASSNGHTCSQSAEGRRPGWVATDRFWTFAGVQFNLDAVPTQASAEWLSCDGLSLNGEDAATIVTVFRTAHDREGTLVAFPNDDDANRIGFDLSTLTGGQVAHRAELSSGTYTTTPGTFAYADDAPHIAIAALGHDSGFDTQDLYADGTGLAFGFANGTGISIANAVGKTYLGATAANAGGSFFRGEIAEVLVYDRVLSDGDRAALTAYLAQKYQVGRTTNVMNMGESGIMRFPAQGALLTFGGAVQATSSFAASAGELTTVGDIDGTLNRVLTDRFWTVSSPFFAGTVDMTLDLSAFTNLDPSALTVASRFDDTDTWRDVRDFGATVTFHDPYVTIAGLTGFSDFALAERGALPVELSAFSVQRDGADVLLRWTTASETNNAGFHVEQQTGEGAGWQDLGFVQGHGTTLQAQQYSHAVRDVAAGTHTFRLRQVDFDGSATYSPLETITILPTAFALRASYPNPATTSATLQFELPQAAHVMVDVVDSAGRQVQTATLAGLGEGLHRHTVDVSALAAGVYHAIVRTDAHRATTPIVVVR
ncbi:MAG: T9SS type A sorting domain-containing protein [Bacteroidota bacterium]